MLDNNWKTWLILVIAIVGGFFEVLKHMPKTESVAWDAENLHYGADGKPYAVHELPKSYRAPRPAMVHVAGDAKVLEDELKKYMTANKPVVTEAKDAAKTKKKKDDDEWEEVIDPVTGKKVRRKKKKDAKADEKPKDEPVLEALPLPPPPPTNDEAAAIAAAVAEAVKTGALPLPYTLPGATNPFASLAEWESLLLGKPNLSETKLFIQDYNEHMVSSTIYYQITAMMLQNSNPQIQQEGILCASSEPSVQSFQLLVGASKSGTPSTQQAATSALNGYATLGDLPILQSALQSSNVNTATEAAQLVDTAAHSLLTTSTPTGNPGTQSTGSANAAHFQPFVPILQQLSTSGNPTLANQARQTLTDLQSLLGGSGGSTVAAFAQPE